PKRPANPMGPRFVASMQEALDRLTAERDEITGVVITSAKKTFFAGGDLDELRLMDDAAVTFENIQFVKGQLRRLETLGKPVVAAVNGSALGGGLEITLACHHRIRADKPKIRLGFPRRSQG